MYKHFCVRVITILALAVLVGGMVVGSTTPVKALQPINWFQDREWEAPDGAHYPDAGDKPISWFRDREWEAAKEGWHAFQEVNGRTHNPYDWGYTDNPYGDDPYPEKADLILKPIPEDKPSLDRGMILTHFALHCAVVGREQALGRQRGDPNFSFQHAYNLYCLASNTFHRFYYQEYEYECEFENGEWRCTGTGAWWDYLWMTYYAITADLLEEYSAYSGWSGNDHAVAGGIMAKVIDAHWHRDSAGRYAKDPFCSWHCDTAAEQNAGHAAALMTTGKFVRRYYDYNKGQRAINQGKYLTDYVFRDQSEDCPTMDACIRVQNWYCDVPSPDYTLDALGFLGGCLAAGERWTAGMLRAENCWAYLYSVHDYDDLPWLIDFKAGYFKNMACSSGQCGSDCLPDRWLDDDTIGCTGYVYVNNYSGHMTNAKGCDATWFTHGMAFALRHAEYVSGKVPVKRPPHFRADYGYRPPILKEAYLNHIKADYKPLILEAAGIVHVPFECPAVESCWGTSDRRREALCGFQTAYHAVAYLILDYWTMGD